MDKMAGKLDWKTAELFTRSLHRDPSNRLSAVPVDIVDTIAPYLHTWTQHGRPYMDDWLRGSFAGRAFGTVNTGFYHTGFYGDMLGIGMQMVWHYNGSLCRFIERKEGVYLSIHWTNSIIVIDRKDRRDRDHVYTYVYRLPQEYHYVWELMTRVVYLD